MTCCVSVVVEHAGHSMLGALPHAHRIIYSDVQLCLQAYLLCHMLMFVGWWCCRLSYERTLLAAVWWVMWSLCWAWSKC